jgi:phospholipid/cholesterol/gamma-HCH transport system permease protein
MTRFFELLGEKTINSIGSFFKALIFSSTIIVHIFNPKSYSPANQRVLVRQIYFTAIQVLPLFSTIAILFGFGIIGVVVLLASKYGLEQSIGKIIITFTIDEAAVFFTALFISLRSSSAINTEIAVMSVRGELNTLSVYGIDAIDYLFLPRVISGVVSTLFLSTLFAIIMLFGGFVFFIYCELPHFINFY